MRGYQSVNRNRRTTLLSLAGVCPCNMGSGRFRGGVKGVELAVEGSGEVVLEGSADFAVASAFLRAFGDVLPRSRS